MAGRGRMPHNNRMSTSGALQTSAIWQKTIGHDPYAGNDDKAKPEPSAADAQAGEEKARQVLEVARKQNLTDGANRDDFAQKMYTGLKGGKRRRADLMNQVDPDKEKIMGILQEDTSSSEEEFVEVAATAAAAAAGKEEKKEKGKRELKKKDSKRKQDRKKRRHKHSSDDDDDDDDSSSDDSSRRERSKRRRREKHKRKRKHRSRHHDRDSDSSADDDDDDSSDRDRKRKHSKRRKEKKRSRSDHERHKSSGDKDRKNDKDDDEKPKEEFVASAEFGGSKKGYSFRAGDRGVGYYLDSKPHVDKKVRDEMLKLYQED
jgi:hypothetical protein